jgi:hypothetical protein
MLDIAERQGLSISKIILILGSWWYFFRLLNQHTGGIRQLYRHYRFLGDFRALHEGLIQLLRSVLCSQLCNQLCSSLCIQLCICTQLSG